MDCLAEQNKKKSTWKHGMYKEPFVNFELYGGFEKICTAYTITIFNDLSLLAMHQNGSRVVIAPSANLDAVHDLAQSISNYWRTGKNNKEKSNV